MLINGKEEQYISVLDRGLCYGDGFFETCLCAEGTLQNWSYHWSRMEKSADILRIPLPEESTFLSDVEALHAQQDHTLNEYVIKIIVTRGSGGRGYSSANCTSPSRIVISSTMPNYQQLRSQGMSVSILDSRLNAEGKIAGLKHLNRLSQVLAKMELDECASDEGIVCNTEGYVREGVSSNVFMVRGKRIITPPLDDCGVAGILRQKVITIAPSVCKADVLEENFHPSDLLTADDIFFTNSLLGVCPARQLQDRIYERSTTTQHLINACLEKD